MSETIFIADLHLSDDTPDLNALLLDALAQWQGRTDALYILGDMFEAWLGDDILSQTAQEVAAALQAFSQTAPVYFICGNRDFLLGKRYAASAGMTVLPEQQVVSLYGHGYLISHGDEMCTADTDYQRFRRIMRHPWVQALLLALPQGRRRRVAAKMRAASQAKKQQMGRTPISDVTESGVQTAFARFPQADAMIHGHTHRPAVHEHLVQGRMLKRYVLPEWYAGQGGYLRVSAEGVTRCDLPEKKAV